MSSLKQKTVSGIKWTMAASIAQRLISFATTVILARILSPADFGLFALAFVMIDGFGIFKSLGFDSALVRRKDEDIAKACNTAFFLIPAMGMILFTILFFFAPIGAKFLNNPEVTPIIRTLAVIFVISTFGKVPQTILYRDMKFKYKSIADVAATLIYTSSAVILALNKFGVWSLVIAYILKNLTQVSIEWYFSGWKPKFEFDKAIAWEMFHFGKFILAGGIIWFFYSNLDNLVIGKILGVTMLGFYVISMNIATFLSQYFLDKVGLIMYPAYSKIQQDSEEVARVMLKMIRYISVVVFPFSFGILIFAPDVLRTVFGEKWLPASNVLRVLSFVGLFRALGSPVWPAFLARGKSKIDFQINLIQVAVFFMLVIPAAFKFKSIGVACSLLLASIVSYILGLFRIRKILNIPIFKILDSLKLALIGALFMVLLVFLTKDTLFAINQKNYFFIAVPFSISVYLGTIYVFNKRIFGEIVEAFIKK